MLTEFPFDFPGKVFRSSMPFGPFDQQDAQWQAYQERGVDLVVVLTEPQEYLVHARRDLPALYRSHDMDVIHLAIPDHGLPPDRDAFREAVIRVEQAGERGRTIAVHCLAGIGRTGTFLACLAVRRMNLSGEEAVRWVREIFPPALETPDQIEFVKNFASRGEDRSPPG